MSKWVRVLIVGITVISIGIAIYESITAFLGVEVGPQDYRDWWLLSAVLVAINWEGFVPKSFFKNKKS
jgi:hypothetical protein